MQKSLHSERNNLFLEMLRGRRTDAAVTLAELAEALGMRQTDISKVERGVRRLDVVELHAWLAQLNSSFIEFAADLDARFQALAARRHVSRRRPD